MGKKPRHKKFPPPPRIPLQAQEPDTHKVPRAIAPPSYHHLRPSWRVAHMDLVDPYGWHAVDAPTLRYIREKLAHFESMTWNEILVVGKKRNHSIDIGSITSEARRRREAIGLGLDEVVSLRLSGAERVFGYLDNGVLVLLWWDPAHQVCPSLRE